MNEQKKNRVLIIAGSDSSGGAGIQADIKTVTCLGGYAMTAITALTAQNTTGVYHVMSVDPQFIVQQIQVTVKDMGVDAIKIGMLHCQPVIEVVESLFHHELKGVPCVFDPVMVSQSGHRLLENQAVDALKNFMFSHHLLATPNIPEAQIITGMKIETLDDMKKACESMINMGMKQVLLKGGHGKDPHVYDVLWDEHHKIHVFQSPRIDSSNNHGTGCTLASAIATGLAQGHDLAHAIEGGLNYVKKAIEMAPDLGQGNGPLYHMHTVDIKDLFA